ncbi:hypothetical protein NW249_23380 [Streptomyces sp. OUCMDZ-4982]|uniref:hypothetical protein n=1 Tax=Streptomyces sp. OUCMDZ-4982 TaxID=2973090 RepID=UPI00215C5C7B|nr:hypothetical protein [Streptomyces sp. OUCMDZ-4982]MCR8945064.1 hypothetical protein [Streptomyces sp. OUCMDZ-4982]
MTAQPDHRDTAPPMRTLAELRSALRGWGFPGDIESFEQELEGTDLDDLSRVRGIVQAYRHRVLLRCNSQAMAALTRSSRDVAFELGEKLAGRTAR